LTTNREGFNALKATAGGVAGGILLGPLGTVAGAALAGTANKNKIWLTCLACGNEFRAGEAVVSETSEPRNAEPEADDLLKPPSSPKIDW